MRPFWRGWIPYTTLKKDTLSNGVAPQALACRGHRATATTGQHQ